MIYTKFDIDDVVLFEPRINGDDRGMVYESYKKESLNDFLGYKTNLCQDNILCSKYGVIRGLHTNTANFVQSKIVSVLKGKILDMVVDFRVGSNTFGKTISTELSEDNKKQLYVPSGFLHGFSVLSEDSIVMIKINRYFASSESIGVKYDDKLLNIDWMIDKKDIILSSVDKSLDSFSNVISPFSYNECYY